MRSSWSSLQTSWLSRIRSAWPRDSSSQTSSTVRASASRSLGQGIPMKSNSTFAPRSMIASWWSRTGYESAWPMTTRPGSAPSSSKIRSWARPTSERTPWVVIASPVRRDARAAARWTRSSAGETHGLSVPISPMIPGRTPRVPHSLLDLADKLVGQVVHGATVDPGLGRVVGRPIPAAAHDEVQAARLGEATQPGRVAPDARQRQVDEAAAACRSVRVRAPRG